MARIWKDRAVEHPRRYKDQNGNILILTPDPGEIMEVGTPVNAANLNGIENDIQNITEVINNSDLNELRGYGRYSFVPLLNDLVVTDKFFINSNTNKAYALRDVVTNGGLTAHSLSLSTQAIASKFTPQIDFEEKHLVVRINAKRTSIGTPLFRIYKANNGVPGELIGSYTSAYSEGGLDTTYKVITYFIPLTQKLNANEEYFLVIFNRYQDGTSPLEISFSPSSIGRPAQNYLYSTNWTTNQSNVTWTNFDNRSLDFDLPQLYKGSVGEKHILEQVIQVPDLYSWGNIKWGISTKDAEVLIQILDTNNNLLKESYSIDGIDLSDIDATDYPKLKFRIEVIKGETAKYTMINPAVTFKTVNTQLYVIEGSYRGNGSYSQVITLTDYNIKIELVVIRPGSETKIVSMQRYGSKGFTVYDNDGDNTNSNSYPFKVFYRR
ncbi:hypothetical protein KQI88_15300 [Alkaliphilus sp. MSJ-5]|uniref:Uncharacterized protein n=1 Tax=Alkaliphilus flagellatus TaxID=2841507 RepID=A0ABS6G5M5_9FIRM|nr:hypothetical protein [Alkaliphilus flagellatus]MBU5677784.1 hypothetical protein [Alkaliphilus flagellatus]